MILDINIIYLHLFGCFMDAYQYALMKETLERIQKEVTLWREGEDEGYDVATDSLYNIETALDEAGFHE